MANLIGYLQGNRGQVSRLGSKDIEATLETWDGSIRVYLDKDGNAVVRIGQKHSPNKTVWEGNINGN